MSEPQRSGYRIVRPDWALSVGPEGTQVASDVLVIEHVRPDRTHPCLVFSTTLDLWLGDVQQAMLAHEEVCLPRAVITDDFDRADGQVGVDWTPTGPKPWDGHACSAMLPAPAARYCPWCGTSPTRYLTAEQVLAEQRANAEDDEPGHGYWEAGDHG